MPSGGIDDGRLVDPASVPHLPPVSPSKTIAVHIAYSSRSIETRNKPRPTDAPTYFTKPSTALNGHRGQILKPADCQYLNYEGEYAVVIGKTCRNVTPDEAWDFIEGFCPALDMGLQNFRDTDQGSMLREGRRHAAAHRARHRARREPVRADAAHLPPSRSVDPGDLVECEITGLGRLAGTVVAIPAPRASALGVGHAPTDSDEVRRVALGFDERVPDRFRQNYRQAVRKEST